MVRHAEASSSPLSRIALDHVDSMGYESRPPTDTSDRGWQILLADPIPGGVRKSGPGTQFLTPPDHISGGVRKTRPEGGPDRTLTKSRGGSKNGVRTPFWTPPPDMSWGGSKMAFPGGSGNRVRNPVPDPPWNRVRKTGSGPRFPGFLSKAD